MHAGLLAREVGYVAKPHAGRLRVALAFPNTYFVGMSNLGFQSVYRLFNSLDDVVCERVFLPPKQELAGASRARGRSPPSNPHARCATSTCSRSRCPSSGTTPTSSRCFAWPGCRSTPRSATTGTRSWSSAGPSPSSIPSRWRCSPTSWRPARARCWSRDRAPRRRRAAGTACSHAGPGARRGLLRARRSTTCATARGASTRSSPCQGADAPCPSARRPSSRGGRGPAVDRHLHARHRVRVAVARRGRARVRQPVPVLLGRLQLPPVRAFPADRILALAEAARRAREPRRPRVDRAVRSPRDRAPAARSCWQMGYAISPASLRLDDLTEPIVRMLRESGERSITIAPETGSDRLRRVIKKTDDQRRDPRPGRSRSSQRHREPEALLHDRPADGDRRGPGGDSGPVDRASASG